MDHLTTQEVAVLCRTSQETVRYWRHVGKGPRGFKLGRKVLYRRQDVEAWLQEHYEADRRKAA
ncbi:MAG: helix-turn-helix domain-containing protein [Bifidobacteriaceae bacterium]|jgi:excisionase family DNA binding protein|nr:helix-turn-helix domain-containing protein [Bifidobacteriaceae bacterium]